MLPTTLGEMHPSGHLPAPLVKETVRYYKPGKVFYPNKTLMFSKFSKSGMGGERSSLGSQEGYIVTGGHMSRCQVCGTRTVLTKEIFFRNGKHETLSMCYDCQDNEEALPNHLPKDLRTISADAARQPPLEKWITKH